MQLDWKASTWRQFGAAIDMLGDTIKLCPDHLWTVVVYTDPDDERYGQFWFIAFHTLRWLDLYLTGRVEGFAPPAPFLLGKLPEQPYTKDEILGYLDACREKCQSTIETLTEEKAQERCVFEWLDASFWELQLYCMRHVQEHTAQLSLVLGQHGVAGMDWVPIARTRNG